MPEVKENPDYQLVMKFLQLIKPGDMDEQSANQLMMIGQRIQNGGALSDREREMFQGVVGAMPEMQMSYEVDGRMEAMTPSQMQAARDSGDYAQYWHDRCTKAYDARRSIPKNDYGSK